MSSFWKQIPPGLRPVFLLLGGLAVFVVWDQWHWWSTKEDYTFGYLVPFFVAYVVYDRWPRLLQLWQEPFPGNVPRWGPPLLLTTASGLVLAGALFYGLGAFYRAGAGPAHPGSLALALGLASFTLGLIYLYSPNREIPPTGTSGSWRQVRELPALKATLLFLFPACIWVISAPLISVVERNLSLFLLNQVTVVVFFTFDMLSLPLERQGNILILPQGQVGVAEACSGIRSLTACLFAGSFLAAVFLDKFWKKVLLVALAMLFAFLTNLLRSLFLTAWAYNYGAEAIEGAVHDITGYAVLGVTCVGLIVLLPLFNLNLEKLVDRRIGKE